MSDSIDAIRERDDRQFMWATERELSTWLQEGIADRHALLSEITQLKDELTEAQRRGRVAGAEITRLTDTLTARNAGQVEAERQIDELQDELVEAQRRSRVITGASGAVVDAHKWQVRAYKAEAELAEARKGDNHHNATKCPYCNPGGGWGDVRAERQRIEQGVRLLRNPAGEKGWRWYNMAIKDALSVIQGKK